MRWKNIISLALVASLSAMSLAQEFKPPVNGEPNYYPPKATNPALVSGPKVTPVMLPAPKDNTFNIPAVEREPNKGMNGQEGPGPYIQFSGAPYTPNAATSGFGTQANSLITSFAGIGQTNLSPPDNTIAVGGHWTVQCVNSVIRITDKLNNILYENTVQSFTGRNAFIYDPKVIFDPWRNRWVMLWHEATDVANSRLLLIVSADSNPFTNGWWYYAFNGANAAGNGWADNFDLGYGSASVVACGNQFTNGGSFVEASFRTWDPAQIYAALAAGMIRDEGLTNADGTSTFAPRAAHMRWSGAGQFFMNSRVGGGSKLTKWLIQDPLGAHTRTRVDINVAAYTVPPSAKSPNGANISTNDCRLSPIEYTANPTSGTNQIFAALNCTSTPEPANAACRLYVVNADNGAMDLDQLLWVAGQSCYYAAPGINYDAACNWVYTGSSLTRFPSTDFVNWEPTTGYSFSFNTIASGAGNSGGRWGDYFQGDTDWGDYYFGGGTAGKQKIWMYGEYANSSSQWATRVGATGTVGNTFGNMNVTPGTGMNFSGYAGSISGGPYNYNVANTGQVSSWWTLSGVPGSVMTASSAGDELWAGTSQNTSISATAGMNSLAYGHYSGNATFKENFSGSTTTRPWNIQVYGLTFPTSLTVKLGSYKFGVAGDLVNVDGNSVRVCKGFVPNLITPPVQVELNSVAPGSTAADFYFWINAKMVTVGSFKMKVELFNFNTNAYDPTNFIDTTVNTTASWYLTSGTGAVGRFIGPGNAVRSKYSIRATGFVASPAWCTEVDAAQWQYVAP